MAQLDPLLTSLVSHGGDTVELLDGSAAMLAKDGARNPMTRQPLSSAQIAALVREIAPADAAAAISAGEPASFNYSNTSGSFTASINSQAGKWSATIRRSGESAAIGSPPQPESSAEIDRLLSTMLERSASDLHLRCHEPPVLRVHGAMERMDEGTLEPAQVAAMLRSIMPARNRTEFAERNDTDFAYEIPGVARFRANVFRDRIGPGAVFRVVPATIITVEELKLSPEIQKLCLLTKGLVLVTGPTGSGKSTTLCALIDLVNRVRNDHIITIEDPIEFVHPNKNCIITQRQVGMHTASFKSALRAALREDPDIILVGELRDLETISIAIETAETGHLVFATLHTTTAAGTIDRIIDQFPADRQAQIRTMLSESLKGVISQTLCRRIGGGRVAAMEILLSTPAVSNLIREGKTFQIPSVMQTSRKLGMTMLNDVLLDLVESNQVEPKEAYMKAVDKTGFLSALKARGRDIE
jgi:twitching motility protein PilT